MQNSRKKNSINRRSFLKSSALIVASVATHTGTPGIIRAQNLQTPVVYALIGSGSQGRNHLRNLATLKNGRCAVLCDTFRFLSQHG